MHFKGKRLSVWLRSEHWSDEQCLSETSKQIILAYCCWNHWLLLIMECLYFRHGNAWCREKNRFPEIVGKEIQFYNTSQSSFVTTQTSSYSVISFQVKLVPPGVPNYKDFCFLHNAFIFVHIYYQTLLWINDRLK